MPRELKIVRHIEGTYDTTEEMVLPSKLIVCPRCDGRGRHDPPAFSNGFTAEDFAEDPDFKSEYFRGMYDVVCEECRGENVTAIPDLDSFTDEQRAAYEDWCRYEDEKAAERRMRERGIEF